LAEEIGAQVESDLAGMLLRDDVDAVCVLTESGNHYRHSRRVLESGKHCIVEKPAAMNVAEVAELGQLAAERGLMYACILQNRLNPAMRALKRAFDQGRFGKVVLATIRLRWCRYPEYYQDGWHGTWAMDGGVINQQALHHVDALQWVCGPIEAVIAEQVRTLNDLEAEDTSVALVRFSSGALGVLEATTAARPRDLEASISVLGETGNVTVGGIALNKVDLWDFVEAREEDRRIPEEASQEVPTGYGLSHGPLLQEIVDRLNAGRIDAPIGASDAIPAIQLIHALYRSVEVRGWVELRDHPQSVRLGNPDARRQ
jgi:predicted dehydrogenase